MSRHHADQEYIHSKLFLILPKAVDENKKNQKCLYSLIINAFL